MADAASDNSTDLLTAALRLRRTRTVCRQFLLLWMMCPSKHELDRHPKTVALSTLIDDPESLLREVAGEGNPDWSVLYHGSVLDD